MFTATITRKTLDLKTKAIYVDVVYTDGTQETSEQLKFGIDVSLEDIKRTIKRFVEMYNGAETKASAITEGALDLTGVVLNPAPTVAEQEKADWFREFNRLEQVQRLITLQALTGTETAVVALRKKVKDNFKPAYIADM